MQFFIYLSNLDPMGQPDSEGLADLGLLMAESFESGMIVATGRIPGTVSHLKLKDGEIAEVEGPFLDGKAMVPGFTIIKVKNRGEAVNWAARLRACMGDGVIRMTELSATGKADL